MSKLHELLAVNKNLAGQANKAIADLTATFEKKRHLFGEKRVTFTASTEGAAPVTEEQSDIQSTIAQELSWMAGIFAKSLDVGYQIDIANTQAKADVVAEDGDVILKDVPATALLQLEKSLDEMHKLILFIPTLDPAKGFAQDPDRAPGVFKAREVTKTRTKKVQTPLVAYHATKEHPAQVHLISEDVPVGKILEQEWSSLLTPAIKSDLLDRVDVLVRAVKKARARANELDIDVAGNRIGKKIMEYIFQPIP